jgi:hypothetical protein
MTYPAGLNFNEYLSSRMSGLFNVNELEMHVWIAQQIGFHVLHEPHEEDCVGKSAKYVFIRVRPWITEYSDLIPFRRIYFHTMADRASVSDNPFRSANESR